MYAEEFTKNAAKYKSELGKLQSFHEYHDLWQRTRLPYVMRERDPYSKAYDAEVQSIYSALTDLPYGVENELTSTKTTPETFERGYPWVTNRLDIISAEVFKVGQAMKALYGQAGEKTLSIVEFGCGWGNLALPLAKAGQTMTVVDIDEAFLHRLAGMFAREKLPLTTIKGDFVEAARRLPQRYDAAVFQASFHHCLDFQTLLSVLEADVLTETGAVYLFSEPVFPDYPFPWGLRFDGESLWAIMVNKWLELGFDQDFFSNLMLRKGFFLEKVPEIPGYLGPGWRCSRNLHALPFANLTLPAACDETFHADTPGNGRFLKAMSTLPALTGATRQRYDLTVRNHGNKPMTGRATCAGKTIDITVAPGAEQIWSIPASADNVDLKSTTFVPNVTYGNGDGREVGLYLAAVACR